MKKIKAKADTRLLAKAGRLFTGTGEGRIVEILQNARRAGATKVDITNDAGIVPVRDNGKGVEDFTKLLDLGGSGWDEAFERSEDPAGVGLFCLAGREVTIRSRGQRVTIDKDGWLGKEVALTAAIELEAFRHFQRQGYHQLPYKDFLRANELGVKLPEATPAYDIGLLEGDLPEPVAVTMPEGFPLARCCRLSRALLDGERRVAGRRGHLCGPYLQAAQGDGSVRCV